MPFATTYLSEHIPLKRARNKTSVSTIDMHLLKSVGVTQDAIDKVNPVHCGNETYYEDSLEDEKVPRSHKSASPLRITKP